MISASFFHFGIFEKDLVPSHQNHPPKNLKLCLEKGPKLCVGIITFPGILQGRRIINEFEPTQITRSYFTQIKKNKKSCHRCDLKVLGINIGHQVGFSLFYVHGVCGGGVNCESKTSCYQDVPFLIEYTDGM